ncbi:MAG: hypothetical protein M0Z53_13090 [Thermaerobacter sp.]|nr:hypothetical protein [Thermaerobacter sp.]
MEDALPSGAPGHFDVVQRCWAVSALAGDAPGNHGGAGQALGTLDMLTETVNQRLVGAPMSRRPVVRTLNDGRWQSPKTPMWRHSPDPQW